jgi:hypothetical protein
VRRAIVRGRHLPGRSDAVDPLRVIDLKKLDRPREQKREGGRPNRGAAGNDDSETQEDREGPQRIASILDQEPWKRDRA